MISRRDLMGTATATFSSAAIKTPSLTVKLLGVKPTFTPVLKITGRGLV